MSTPSLYGNAVLHTSINKKNRPPLGDNLYNPAGSKGVILGTDPQNPNYCIPWWLSKERGHALCFSATGGGKNTNLITPALLTYSGNVFCLDPKGENAWISAPRRRELGQRVIILDPWNKVNESYGAKVGVTEQVSRFNPLSTLDPNSRDFNDDVTLIADGVIITPERTDPHWSESARELVAGLIAASVERAPGIASLGDVRALLTASNEALAIQVQKIVANNPDSLGARKLSRFTSGTTEISSIRSTAETQTAIFDAAALIDSMSTGPEAFDLSELATGQVSVFVVLPADKLLTHGRWMRLIIQLALRSIARVHTPPALPCLFLLDELGTINPGGGLRMIEQAYGLMGSMGIRVWGFFQTLGQLQRDYPGSWQDMIGNAETIQIMKVNDSNTANYFSNHVGMSTWIRQPGGQWKPSLDGKNKSRMKWANDRIITEDSQMTSRPAILPQEIMRLQKGEVVSLFSGQEGWRLPTLTYFQNFRFSGMFRANPLFPAAAPLAAPASSSGASVGSAKAWFSALSMKGKVGVGAAAMFGLYVIGHIL